MDLMSLSYLPLLICRPQGASRWTIFKHRKGQNRLVFSREASALARDTSLYNESTNSRRSVSD